MIVDSGGRGPRDWQLQDVFPFDSDWSDEAKIV